MPNPVLQDFLREQITPYFGGGDWKNCREDLTAIEVANRNFFVLSIFMIVLTDQCLFRNYNELYAQWRKQTHFPKFGSVGFGVHNENPFKLLSIPERDAIIDVKESIFLMPGFIRFFKLKLVKFFPNFDVNSFFEKIRSDAAYQLDEGSVLKAFKLEFEKSVF